MLRQLKKYREHLLVLILIVSSGNPLFVKLSNFINKDCNGKPDSLKRSNAQIKKGNDIFVRYFTT